MSIFKTIGEKLRPKSGETVELEVHLGDELLEQAYTQPDMEHLETITAQEALSLLRAGKPLVRKRVKGDLLLGREGLGDPFEFELDEGRKVALALVSAPPEFERTRFAQKLEVKGCLFEGRVQCAGLYFERDVEFSGTTFQTIAEFQYSVFDETALFYQCRFAEKAKFGDTHFSEGAHFNRTTFVGPADFYNATFRKPAGFAHVVFQAYCNLSQTEFHSPEILNPCLDFRYGVCHEAAYLAGAKFKGIADFTGTQFRRQADFAEASFEYVNFTNVEFGRLDLKWEQIAGHKLLFGKIIIKDFNTSQPSFSTDEFNKMFRRREDTPLPDKHRQYDILKAIFIRQGDHVSADGCYYEWKQVERRQSPLGLNPEKWMMKAFHYLNWLSCGYGGKPIRTVLFGLVTILVFAVAYLILDLPHDHAGGVMQESAPLLAGLSGKLGFSFSTFMSYGASPSGLSPAAQVLFWIERLIGWLTLLLFVTTYTRLMMR